jgi:transposase
MRHGQCLLRRPAQGGPALYQADRQPLFAAVRRLPVGIAASYPEAHTIHLVMDNLSSHNRKALVDRFGEKIGGLLWERFTVHYTPKHGSWLNQAEIEISLFSRQCLGRRRIPSLRQLQQQARAWNRKMIRDRVTINWKFTRKKARQKFGNKRNKFTRSET